VDKLSSRIEVNTHVESRGVVSLNAVIGDVHSSVILGSTAPLALCTVQDVCNAKFGQLTAIRCDVSAEKRRFYGSVINKRLLSDAAGKLSLIE